MAPVPQIVDVDKGHDIQTHGVPGELRVHTPAIMKGYKDRPVASAICFDEQRFFRTGDFGYRDQDGYIFILGRVKELLSFNDVKVRQRFRRCGPCGPLVIFSLFFFW